MFKNLEIKLLLLVILGSLLLVSCEDETKTLDSTLFGYEFFPLEEGKYWIYKMDQTLIKNQGTVTENSIFYLREDITERFVNTTGDTIYKIERSTSESFDGNYVTTDVWTAQITEEAAYRTEENLRFVKMVFPFYVGTTWEGNLFDNLVEVIVAEETVQAYKDWGDYKIAAKGIAVSVEGINYDNVVTIDQASVLENDIEYRVASEQYALGVGMIKKQLAILDTQCECEGQTWLEKAEAGFTLTQTLVETN